MLPHTRPAFLKSLGLAVLANLAAVWAWAVIPVLAVAVGATFAAPPAVRPTPSLIAVALALGAAYQVLAFGALAWLARVRGWLLRARDVVAVTLAVPGLVVCGVAMIAAPKSLVGSGALAVTFVVVGSALALSAYFRWARTEFPQSKPSKTVASL
jgi:hypothetical protein